MAVLGRVLFSSGERVDLPDLLSIDSYGAGDWRYFMQSIVGTSKPYILTGFDVISPEAAISLPTCSIRVADSIVYYPASAAGPFFYGLPEGDVNSEPLVPQLRANTANYVYLTLSTFNTASDTRALWDPDRNGGAGAEFTQDINTESVIQAQVNVSTGSFPVNTVPIAIITMGPSTILSIQDARDMLFRLGTGGLNPNPLNTYSFRDLPSSSYARSEPNTTISNLSDPNPFQGGDKNVKTLKEWMDLVMTKLRELGGTKYWYEETDTFGLVTLFQDALASSWKSKGSYTHSSATAGQLSWSEDIYLKSTVSPRDVVIRASGASPLNIGNEQVAFISLVRNQPINTLDSPVAFTNGQAYVNTLDGSVGLFQNLKKGDWIKKSTDADVLFLQVREFYNTTQSPGPVAGSSTTAGAARSIILSGAYQGTTSQPTGDRARYDRGEYQPTDIQVVSRANAALAVAGGDSLWFALRSDTVMALSTISTKTVSGTVAVADGQGVTVSATAHGMVENDRITVTAPVAHAGTYTVDVVDANTFVIKSTNTTTGAFTGYYGTATTTSTSVNSFQLESANHGLDSGETIAITGTTNFNGSYVVNVRSATQFQFPIAAAQTTESSGTMTLARMDVRSEEGVNKLVQGETIDIGSNTSDNIRAFIGMTSPEDVVPVYAVPASYNTLNAGANYNSAITDDLTTRVSKNTAMLMDKAQDKNIQFFTNAVEATNTASGSLRNLSFVPPSSTLTLIQPGSPGNATVTLPSAGSPLALDTNQCAYVTITRNASSTPGIVVASTSAVPVDENVFVIASRLSDEKVFLWTGDAVLTTAPLAPSDPALIAVTYHNPVSTTLPTGNPVTVDGLSISAGDTVLFTALSSGSNRIYKAQGVTTNITGWESASYAFHDSQSPIAGDSVVIRRGTAFALQVGRFDGTSWVFNDKIRYFNGSDYFEQSNIVSATIANNTTATLVTSAWSGNEHMIIDYSIVRSTIRETGTMRIVTDGTSASLSTSASYLNGNAGVTFNARISGANLIVEYTSTNTGQTGTVKYMVKRWSSGTGGPAGIPTYTGGAAAPTAAGGPVGSIQFNSGGAVTGNANFAIDTIDLSINLNGLRQGVLSSPITLLGNQASWTNLVTLTEDDQFPFLVLEYSVSRGASMIGQMLITHDGSTIAFDDRAAESASTGVTLQAIYSSGSIIIQYQTTGAPTGTFSCSWRKWG
jgi:hypothetical protein